MARTKVKLQYISNDTLRRTTLRKRSTGLMKKLYELSVLCGVDACGIIYTPGEETPQIWPEAQDARRILNTFNKLPEGERTRRMSNHESFMSEQVAALRQKVTKVENDNTNLAVSIALNEEFSSSSSSSSFGSEFSARELSDAEDALDKVISKIFDRLTEMSLSRPGPPQPNAAAVETSTHRGKFPVEHLDSSSSNDNNE